MTQADDSGRTLTEQLAIEDKNGTLNLTRRPKVPTIQLPSSGDMRKTIQPIKDWIDQATGSSGSVLDKHLTLRDLLNDGAVSLTLGSRSYSGSGSGIGTGSGGGSSSSLPTLLVPPTPVDLVATGAFRNVILTWDMTAYANHAYVEVWRAATDDLGLAVIVGTSTADLYDDADVTVGSTYYYWVRAIAIGGAEGAYNAVGGTMAALETIGNTDLGALIVEAANLANGAVTSIKVGTAAIGTAAIQNLAVTNALIDNLAVDNAKIANVTITGGKIAVATITATQIAANTITAGQIAATTITTDRLVVNAATVAAAAGALNSAIFLTAVSSVVNGPTTIVSLTSTGAPVTVWGNCSVGGVVSTTALSFVSITVFLKIDSTNVKSFQWTGPAYNFGTSRGWQVEIPLLWRDAGLAAGNHDYKIEIDLQFFDSSGAALAVTGSWGYIDYVVVTENKV